MSDLQIGLLLIGVLIVAGVLLFNWIQERRFRRQADAAFQAPFADALMPQPGAVPREANKRIEPALKEPVFDAARVNEVAEVNEPHLSADVDRPQVEPASVPVEETAPAATEPAAAEPRRASRR